MTESPHVTTCPDTKMTRIGTGDEKKVILNVNRRRSPDTSALTSGTLAHNPRCSRRRRIDEADISRPVAVDQSDSNCLEKAVRSLTTMRSRCRSLCASVTFFGSLPVVQFVRCSLDKCFHIRLTVELFR
ncbi:uncharacterized protein TNCV_3183751 [Trichonephila clavipes]|nr:uncharacterized protein TNCV_3183751 [Trichonephila clavipes]